MEGKVINGTKVLTGEVRFSYVNIDEPVAMEGSDSSRYRICILIPKTDISTINAIKQAVEEAKKVGAEKGMKGLNKTPLRDGDVDRAEDEVFAGMMFLNASSMNKPIVINETNTPSDTSIIYSGAYGRAYLNFYPFAKSGNKGIGCGIAALQKLRDGENLGGDSLESVISAFSE